MLAMGPFLYFFVRKLIWPQEVLGRKIVLHFIPLLPEMGLQLSGHAVPAIPWLEFLSVSGYLYLSRSLIEEFYRQRKFSGIDRFRYQWQWLQKLLMGAGAVWLFLYPIAIAFNLGQLFHLLMEIVLVRVAALVFLREEKQMANVPRPSAPLPTAGSRQQGAWLKNMMASQRYYLDPGITLNTLAGKLQLTPHELSRIINTNLNKGFHEFINEYRVHEVVRRMQGPDNDHLTLLGIAFDSGFNAKTSFHRGFKEVTGLTPAQFRDNLKKEVPVYKPGPSFPAAQLISMPLNRCFMFKNYLKMAWRNMRNNKVYTILNIAGLATGMAVALLIGLWVYDQYTFDRFLPGYRQAYSVRVNYADQHEGVRTTSTVAIPLADVLRTTVPGIQYVAETDMDDFQTRNLTAGEHKLLVDGGTVAPDFLHIFRYPLLRGNVNEVLKDPYSIVLDESTARSLFGHDDPIGKTIRVDNKHDVKVTGLMKDFPANSSFSYHFLIPYSYAEQTEDWVRNARAQWDNSSFEIFVGLQAGVPESAVASRIRDLVYGHNPNVRAFKPEVFLYPLKDWHLRSDFKNGKAVGGFISYVQMFAVIGLLVLLIACINFVNLSTARSEKRAREVGVRKAIGSSRRDLVFQFLTESVLLTFLAFLLSIGLVQLAVPEFSRMTGSVVRVPYAQPVFWCIMAAYVLATGILAGCRPAFYLSSFIPVKVLKGIGQTGKVNALPRKVLVVAQFSCSVAFIISTLVIYQQIRYAKDRPTGYRAERLVSTFITKDLADHYDAFKSDLLASGMVESLTKASSPVTNIGWHTNIAGWPGQTAGEQAINVGAIITDDHYFETVGMELLEGHGFSGSNTADAQNIIVNETAVKRMGLKGPIEQLVNFKGINGQSRIIGVVKDALMESPFKPVEPLVFVHGQSASQVIYRLAPGKPPHEAIEKIGHIFDRYNPAYPFTYSFVDDAYNRKFNLESLVGKLAGIFAGLAIFVSCLGLFGLAAYVAEQRTKEIAVRKVLGASITQVWAMLSRDFVLLVIISCVLATPVAWYFLDDWLQKYDYRITIGPAVFVLAATATLLITLATISFQAIKAALANPVKSLRSE